MNSLFSSRKSSCAEVASPLIHSPMPVRKRGSLYLKPRISKATLVDFNDTEDDARPSRFFFEKLKQLRMDYEDEYKSPCTYASEDTYHHSNSEESVEERKTIVEMFEASCNIQEARPMTRAFNPQVLNFDQEQVSIQESH